MLGLFRRKEKKKEVLATALSSAEIPAFPQVAFDVLKMLRDPDSSMKEIAKRVELDPGLSVKMLKTVNSAAYGLRRPARTVEHAVTMLGRAGIEPLVLALAVGKAVPKMEAQGFEAGRFWRGAARRSAIARTLAKTLCPGDAGFVFTAALLQDMAVPLLTHHGLSKYGQLLEHWHHDGGALDVLEESSFGWDHADIGVVVGAKWELPDDLMGSIGAHHGALDDVPDAANAVNLVAHLHEEDDPAGVEVLVERVHAHYGVPKDRIAEAVKTGLEQADEVAKVFAAA